MADRTLSVALRQRGPIPLDVEFTCHSGDVLAIFGPSGSGKTTILRSIAGLYEPSHASIYSGADPWTDTETETFVPPHRRAVGLVFQEYALFPHMTAVGNVITALGHRPRSERRNKAEALLNLVHLGERLSRRPSELSGGERQRVALDMPLVLVTHDFEDVVRLATHVLILEHGRAVACGPISALMSRPDLAWLREAVGLGSVFDATVTRLDRDRGLVELTFDGGTLLAPARHGEVNAAVRVRIPAREVVLATSAPTGLSLHNVLAGTVTDVHADAAFETIVVQLAVGRVVLLAEVTRDAVTRLGINVGQRLHALIKSVSIELLAPQS